MKTTLEQLAATQDVLLADGATGTNLFTAGLKQAIRLNFGMLKNQRRLLRYISNL